jgi:DUF438 domain-containing protein
MNDEEFVMNFGSQALREVHTREAKAKADVLNDFIKDEKVFLEQVRTWLRQNAFYENSNNDKEIGFFFNKRIKSLVSQSPPSVARRKQVSNKSLNVPIEREGNTSVADTQDNRKGKEKTA